MGNLKENLENKDEITEKKNEIQETVSDAVIAIIAEGFRKGLLQKQIAKEAGISPGYLSKLKTRALTGKYENLLPIREALLGAVEGADAEDTEDEIITAIREALKPRKTTETSTTELLKLTPTERKVVNVGAEEVTEGQVHIFRREIKETIEDPSLADLLKAYAILEKHKKSQRKAEDKDKIVVIGQLHEDCPPVDGEDDEEDTE